MTAHTQKRETVLTVHHSGKNKGKGNWFPLGYAQLCFWFVSTALGDTANNQVGILIEGDLRTNLLEQAINNLIQSHISLRTEILDYVPMQRTCHVREFDLPLQDLSGYDADEQEQFIIKNARQFLNTPFDLKSPPHLRAQLFRLEESKHLLFLCFPHIVADGGAMHLFEQQLWRFYAQGCQGKKNPLRIDKSMANQMQIDEWVRYEREIHQRQGQQDLAFWRRHLMGYSYARFPASDLNQVHFIDHEFYLPFPDDSYALLNVLAKQYKATLQMVFLTLVAEVVHEMTGQSRFSLNSVLEGREQPGSETLMAPMLRVMPVPINMDRITAKAAELGRQPSPCWNKSGKIFCVLMIIWNARGVCLLVLWLGSVGTTVPGCILWQFEQVAGSIAKYSGVLNFTQAFWLIFCLWSRDRRSLLFAKTNTVWKFRNQRLTSIYCRMHLNLR
ncbi:condensation domain-containing protein [Xenorhabdus siamensis]|uniref:condensation domain-containing protein n=1 Tax=Xenorhabdus siamensis TaxID=3136254 RepID=UPI0030F3EE75